MSKRDYFLFIEDVVSSIEKIEKYIKDVSFEEFSENDMVMDAVIRNFAVVGEAVKKIPREIKEKHTYVEWKEAAGFRDILIHEYFGVDPEAVWETIKNNLPSFKENILKVLKCEKKLKKINTN